MRPARSFHVLVLTAALLALLPAVSNAAQAPITGTLSSSAPYSVIAIAPNGLSTTTRTRKGRFTIVPPAATTTLHLRLRGDYRGPIVLRSLGTDRVVLGVRAGARLGAIRVFGTYARVSRMPASTAVDLRRYAASSLGVPRGAASLGRFNMRKIKFKSSRVLPVAAGPGGDSDFDGLVDAFDVDDDGDLVLDNVDPADGLSKGPGTRAATEFWVFSNYKLNLEETVNYHVGGLAREAIDSAMRSRVGLAMQRLDGDVVELDCGGLRYCSSGGTGFVQGAYDPTIMGFTTTPFPSGFDDDADGFGAILADPTTGDFQLRTGASSAEIGAGDTYVQLVSEDGVTSRYSSMLNTMFNTVPALRSWSSDAGDATTMTYPVAAGGPGTRANPFPVSANASGDVVLTLTLWRPQRTALRGEPSTAGWVDIGRMFYEAWMFVERPATGPGTAPTQEGGGNCPPAAYAESDPTLSGPTDRGVLDLAPDRAASSANLITFTVNLSACARHRGATFDSGDVLTLNLEARSRFGDNAGQNTSFVRR